MYNDNFLYKKLAERIASNAFRQLRLPDGKVDICSNDYLGIVKNRLLNDPVPENNSFKTGATGSRLLAGNYALIEETEKQIALFHEAETALIFNSGYDANLGVLSSLPQRGDIILYDYLSHASIRDGIRLSLAQSYSFAHNELTDLEKKLQQSQVATWNNIFIATESVFSMDGDLCPIEELVFLAKKYNAHVIMDEAHATGVVGERGEGLVQQYHLQDQVFCRIHTFGKACGCHGAAVLGSQLLRDHCINFARSFIYSTALPEQAAAIIQRSYQVFPSMDIERKRLQDLISLFQSSQLLYEKLLSQTPIQIVIIPGNEAVKKVADTLQQNGFDVRPILYPTVPAGKERLRIVLHAFNTEEELRSLIELLNQKLIL